MTTITRFTKEQLIAKLQHRLTVAAKYPDVEEAELDAAIFQIALTSLTAEPVLYAAEETLAYANMGELHLKCLSQPMGDAVIPLYTAPPAPVVPTFDEWLEVRGNKPLGWVKDAMRESYDACRAAMLQGSQPVSNRDELPDIVGWIRSDYHSDRRMGDAPIFILGCVDPSDVWGVKYVPLTGNSPVIPDGCLWTYDDHDYKWNSACGESWTFIDDGPEENGVKFCQGCGKPVVLSVAPQRE